MSRTHPRNCPEPGHHLHTIGNCPRCAHEANGVDHDTRAKQVRAALAAARRKDQP